MTQYAPVIIATLNRYAYLKRCLESLEKNTDAEKTEVYVSVDFPPSEKYYSGYEEVVKYLKHKEKKNAFNQWFYGEK